MKIALIGVGSFVFGPSALYDAIIEHDIPDLHLALVDRDAELAGLMAGVANRMARDIGRDVTITVHTDWNEALDGCDFVCLSAALDLLRRFQSDTAIIHQEYPEHVITEFGGVAGISYSLRQIALVTRLTSDMRARCPQAWLLTTSNPLARVGEAAQSTGIRTAAFCSNSMAGYGTIGRLLQGWNEIYPWPEATSRYEATMGGVNHFAFLVGLQDRETGDDLLTEFTQRAHQDQRLGPVTRDLLTSTGWFNPNGDDHIRDFLAPIASTQALTYNAHGDPSERLTRLRLLHDVGQGAAPVVVLLEHRAWERPIAFAAAYSGLGTATFHSVNLPNEGQLTNIRLDAFVETPVTVSAQSVRPHTLTMPEPLRAMTDEAAELSHRVVAAALNHDREALLDCIDADPTVLDNTRGRTALIGCLRANADVIGYW